MKIYKCTNTNNRSILIVAKDEERAIELSVAFQLVRSPKTVTVQDVTESYTTHHSQRGFVLPNKEGQLWQRIDRNVSTWNVYTLD